MGAINFQNVAQFPFQFAILKVELEKRARIPFRAFFFFHTKLYRAGARPSDPFGTSLRDVSQGRLYSAEVEAFCGRVSPQPKS
jgi:hypothetical protein